jgi:hypothetical protein
MCQGSTLSATGTDRCSIHVLSNDRWSSFENGDFSNHEMRAAAHWECRMMQNDIPDKENAAHAESASSDLQIHEAHDNPYSPPGA